MKVGGTPEVGSLKIEKKSHWFDVHLFTHAHTQFVHMVSNDWSLIGMMCFSKYFTILF